MSDGAARNSLATLCRPSMEALSAETDLMVNLQVLEAEGTRVVEVVQPARLLMIAHLRDELLTWTGSPAAGAGRGARRLRRGRRTSGRPAATTTCWTSWTGPPPTATPWSAAATSG